MENIKLVIRERYSNMSKAEKRISDFILQNASECLKMTALDIAKESEVSSASVIRYVQKLGFDGLDEFKLNLAASNSKDQGWKMVDPIVSKDDDLDGLCNKMSVLVEAAYKDFFFQLDKKALEQAILAVKKARRIYLLGIGASMLPAYDLFHKLRRIDLDANYYADLNMLSEFFNYIDERDVVIAFSYSGQSKEIIYPCEIAKKQKAVLITVTRNQKSVLHDMADICLTVPDKEALMRSGAFTSVYTSIMMADLLYMGVVQENFDETEVKLVQTRKMVEGLKTKN